MICICASHCLVLCVWKAVGLIWYLILLIVFSLWALHLLNAEEESYRFPLGNGFSLEEAIILPNGGLDRRKQVTEAMCMRSAWLQWPGAADAASESQAAASSDTVQHQDLTVHYIFTIRMQKKSHLQMQTMQSLKKLSFFLHRQCASWMISNCHLTKIILGGSNLLCLLHPNLTTGAKAHSYALFTPG